MRLDWKAVGLLTVSLLLKSGCVSVRYDDKPLPIEPTPALVPAPATCSSEVEWTPPQAVAPQPMPQPAIASDCTTDDCQPQHQFAFNFHHKLKNWLHRPKHQPAVAPVIPPHSKFHPVPTRPVFAAPVIFYDDVPRPLPTKMAKPMPVPPPADITPESNDHEVNAPMPLEDELRIASPISLNGPVRPIANGWKAIEHE